MLKLILFVTLSLYLRINFAYNMSENIKIIAHTDNFIHVRTEEVPDWLFKLEAAKDKLIEKIDASIKAENDAKINLQPCKNK